ncbi:MAG TPA: archease [Thermodesulfobacteriota bacterium]|nr:archease [Thermodesulfobacteriota bacterium]
MPYTFIEGITLADSAFEAWGRDLEETFRSAADATMNVMVEELDSIQPKESRGISIEHDALDLLLFNFLQEFIYYKDSEQLLLRVSKLIIQKNNSHYTLKTTALGEKIDPNRHRMRVDVKAVTLHRFSLEETTQGWKASVILDI